MQFFTLEVHKGMTRIQSEVIHAFRLVLSLHCKLYRHQVAVFFTLFVTFTCMAQADTLTALRESADSSSTTQEKDSRLVNRQRLVGYGSVALYGGLLYTLNKAWYSKYPRSGFHFYNDNAEWKQVDKTGHGWTAFQLTRMSYAAWKWASMGDKKALLLSGISGPGFLTVIEILDGFSSKWGFSLGDMGANLGGSALFIGQQALWKEERISLKFSFHKINYGEPMLETRANNLFGKHWNERMLKDYNAQSYWLSANLKSFFPRAGLPVWLNIAVGYGAEGMLGGYRNQWTNADGSFTYRSDIPRKRQFYLAPDIDLTRIKTNKKYLKNLFFLFNSIKVPAPSLMMDQSGKLKGYLLYF